MAMVDEEDDMTCDDWFCNIYIIVLACAVVGAIIMLLVFFA